MTIYVCVQNNVETKVHFLSNSSEEWQDFKKDILNQKTQVKHRMRMIIISFFFLKKNQLGSS